MYTNIFLSFMRDTRQSAVVPLLCRSLLTSAGIFLPARVTGAFESQRVTGMMADVQVRVAHGL